MADRYSDAGAVFPSLVDNNKHVHFQGSDTRTLGLCKSTANIEPPIQQCSKIWRRAGREDFAGKQSGPISTSDLMDNLWNGSLQLKVGIGYFVYLLLSDTCNFRISILFLKPQSS